METRQVETSEGPSCARSRRGPGAWLLGRDGISQASQHQHSALSLRQAEPCEELIFNQENAEWTRASPERHARLPCHHTPWDRRCWGHTEPVQGCLLGRDPGPALVLA